MDALRTLTSALGHYDPDAADNSPQANYRKAVRLTAQLGSLVATMGRLQKGGAPLQPDPVLSHAANFLYMLTGDRPSGLATRAFDVALILHADHELNASTFAARVAAATLTDIHSAIGRGDRGIEGAAARRRQRRRDAAAARDRSERAGGEGRGSGAGEAGAEGKDSGVRSSRVSHRRSARHPSAADVARSGSAREPADLVRDVAADRVGGEDREEAERRTWISIRAPTYHSLGSTSILFTPIFAVSRISGWTAHVLEQYANNRLIRPRAEYVGPSYPQRTSRSRRRFARSSRSAMAIVSR
jgi:citrate synthase